MRSRTIISGLYTLAGLLIFCHIELFSAIINVPADYPSIQAAINASAAGDTIVVSPGIYYENLNFRGRNIVLTSLFYMDQDTSYISSTVINGSAPSDPDTASCVIFCSGEDSTAVLQGFTLTGGSGTIWTDIHGAGNYREGGGILIELSSPTVRHNVITNNSATSTAGVTSAGGGGIRIGDGNPYIENNVISYNQGRYGAGIVLNYTGCTIRNNLIMNNSGGQEFYGGSGIWIYNNLPAKSKTIENNTIAHNSALVSGGTGGILVWSSINVNIRNNIVYGNNSVTGIQIKAVSATPQVNYCDVGGGYATGTGNIDLDPVFAEEGYFLKDVSPCIDAGDPEVAYNDPEDPGSPGNAMFPSKGAVLNDMGAYGGPGATVLPGILLATGLANSDLPENQFHFSPNPFSTYTVLQFPGTGTPATVDIIIADINGKTVKIYRNYNPGTQILTDDIAPGVYFFRISTGDKAIGKGKVIIE